MERGGGDGVGDSGGDGGTVEATVASTGLCLNPLGDFVPYQGILSPTHLPTQSRSESVLGQGDKIP